MSGGHVMSGALFQVMLGITDLERSVEFYERILDAKTIAVFDPPGLAFFQLGSVRLLLERTASLQPGGGTLYLRVEDIHASVRALAERGVEFVSEPHLIHRDEVGSFGEAGSEEWMAFFEDPDGNSLAIASRVKSS